MELDWLKRWAAYDSDACAIYDADEEQEVTYGALFERVKKVATVLCDLGVSAGDRVAVLSKNAIEHIELFFACQRVGAILVPLNFRLSERELQQISVTCEPNVLFTESEFDWVGKCIAKHAKCRQISFLDLAERTQEASPQQKSAFAASSAPILLLFTSGTTGVPKGVMISHDMILWNSINTGLALGLTGKDVILHFHPFFHTSGWNVLLTPVFHRGGRVIFMRKFAADRALQLSVSHKVTVFFGVPTMMDMIAREPAFESAEFPAMRCAIVGGEPMPLPLITRWQQKDVPIRQGYGLTEFGPNVFSLSEKYSETKAGSIGVPNFYVEVKLQSESGAEANEGEVGELLLKGPMCTPGYWKNESATTDAIRDGWLRTGDLVRRDGEGFYYVVGRKKDMYISGGENVYPGEVEAVLQTHPKIAEVAVIGTPDERWGEVGRAFIVTKAGCALSEAEILEHCRNNLAKYKVPKTVMFLTELPKSDSGKILKRALVDK